MSHPIPLEDASLDKVTGGAVQQGTAGRDVLQGTPDADHVYAGGGNDVITSGDGNDRVYGEDGNDAIHTGTGDDLAVGGSGNDSLNGGAGRDQLYGESGNDLLDGGARDGATDHAFGGDGDDSYIWAPGDGNDNFQGGAGSDTLRILGMSLNDLQNALRLDSGNLTMSVANNAISFTDANGNPASFSGVINFGGEIMRFSGIEQIKLS